MANTAANDTPMRLNKGATIHEAGMFLSRAVLRHKLGMKTNFDLDDLCRAKLIVDLDAEKNAAGLVYLIKKRGLVKIGYTKNHEQRFANLERQGGEKIKILAMVPGEISHERALHKRFSEYRTVGEWFQCKGDLAEFCRAPVTNMKKAVTA